MLLRWLLPPTSILLNLLVIFFLIRGPLKRFPLVLSFCGLQTLFVITLLSTAYTIGLRDPLYARMWWTGDFAAHLGITLVIVSLIRDAWGEVPYRNILSVALVIAVVSVGIISWFTFQQPHLTRWMTPITRNLSFAEEMLNFILWGALLQKRELDSQLLMVSAGIGTQVTGEVIGHTLRLYTAREYVWVPDLLRTLCEFLCLLLWIWAFRSRQNPSAHVNAASIEANTVR